MANKSYVRGSNFEIQVQRKLEKAGYYCMRSAGSHTVVDVMAIKEDSILLIQCKTSSVEEIPDLKQLLKSFEKDGVTKTNIKILEELDTPLIVVQGRTDAFTSHRPTKKKIIWKGKGRNNIRTFEWTGIRWVTSHIMEYGDEQESQII